MKLGNDCKVIRMEYPLIHQSNQRPVHFVQGYVDYLGGKLGIPLTCTVRRPYLYLSDNEKQWTNGVKEHSGYDGKYWLICTGVKPDYTVKGWGHENYQAVVDMLSGVVQFVQVGESHHSHKPLAGAIDFIGKTNTRQLIRLAHNAEGGIGGVSFLHHIFGALEKPFVTLASGMEPESWEHYHTGRFLHKGACVPCGRPGGCWKARVVALGDGDKKDKTSLCVLPVQSGEEYISRCMELITPDEVVRAVLDYYSGNVLS